MFSPSSALPSTSSLCWENSLFVHGSMFSDQISLLFGKRSSVLLHSLSGHVQQTFKCAMKPPISSFLPNLLYYFLETLLFFPSTFLCFSWHPSFFSVVRIRVQHVPRALSVSTFSGLQRFSQLWLPGGTAHNPNTSNTTPGPLHFGLFSFSCRALSNSLSPIISTSGWSPFPAILGPHNFPGIHMYLPHLMQRYLFAAAHHSVRCFFSSTFSVKWLFLHALQSEGVA